MRAAAVVLALSFAPSARAQTPPPRSAAEHGPSPRDRAILQGVEAYRQQRWDAAVASFREAARIDGASALPQLYLGYTAAARGDAASAQGFLREALRLAAVAADEPGQARARIALAMLLEAGGSREPARAEWEQYVRFADGHANAAPGGIGRARLDAFVRRSATAQESEGVRRRIEERLRLNASGANQTAPPGMVAAPPAGPR